MYGLRVWYKDGRVETFHFETEESRKKKADYYRSLNRVSRVKMLELEDCL